MLRDPACRPFEFATEPHLDSGLVHKLVKAVSVGRLVGSARLCLPAHFDYLSSSSHPLDLKRKNPPFSSPPFSFFSDPVRINRAGTDVLLGRRGGWHLMLRDLGLPQVWYNGVFNKGWGDLGLVSDLSMLFTECPWAKHSPSAPQGYWGDKIRVVRRSTYTALSSLEEGWDKDIINNCAWK